MRFLIRHPNFDELVKSAKTVMPADAGIQNYLKLLDTGACSGVDPGFAGVTKIGSFWVFTISSVLTGMRLPRPAGSGGLGGSL
jgi:hypothetical protein